MAAPFNKFNSFVEAVAEKKHDLGADVLKCMLTNVAPVAANAVKTDITEIAAGNGYTAGGNQATQTGSVQSGGVSKPTCSDPTIWTCVTAPMATFRYVVMYNDTAANDELIGWWDYGSAITPQIGEKVLHSLDPPTGLLTLP